MSVLDTAAVNLPSPPEPSGAERPVVVAAHVLATVTVVGLLAGGFVVGVLGRSAMALLAHLNPPAHGLRSDDGFLIGQFTLSGSLQLVAAGLQLGAVGAFAYVAARGLMVGPGWFRLLSISLGPGVVVGALVVKTEGVDFTRLDPALLSVALFVALPTVFVALLHLGSERALRRWPRLPVPLLVVGLLPWLPLLPLTLLLVAGWWTVRAWRRAAARSHGVGLAGSATVWLVRGGLALVFCWAVLDLVSDLRVLG